MKKTKLFSQNIISLFMALCLITGLIITGPVLIQHLIFARYNALSDEEKLEYILDNYYEDIGNYLNIAKKDMIPRQNIMIVDTLSDPSYIAEYHLDEDRILLKRSVLNNIGCAVYTLVHEIGHYKQALLNGKGNLAYDYKAQQDNHIMHDDNTYEYECEQKASLYTASRRLIYFNNKGCSFLKCTIAFIKGKV